MVINMKVYLDILFFFNFIFDFIILLSSSIILKRNTKIYRIILGSLFGSVTLISLNIPFTTFSLFLFKIIISSLMIIITFNFKNIRYFFNNIYYFYLISIILGGLLYFINNSFSKSENYIFFNTFRLNLVLSIFISLVGIYLYIKNIKKLKNNYNKYLNAVIYFKDYNVSVNAFLDTGNKLIDPYLFRPIILVNKNRIVCDYDNYILVPFSMASSDGLLKCISANKIYIEGIGYKKNFLVGLIDSINIDGIDCLLNERLMEG